MAIIASSPAPLLLLDGECSIIAASASFCETYGIPPPGVLGARLLDLGAGEWNVPQLRSLLAVTGSGAATIDSYEMDLVRPGRETRRLTIQPKRLAYADLEHPRMLVAISDVTDLRAVERAKDEALARNSVLLQEVRHRVANSLQIVASVLLQTARRAQSKETRGKLQDAHQRVMSVAALERLLSGSPDPSDEQVDIHAYFSRLCDSIAASLIGAEDKISLRVVGVGAAPAGASVSLGLIVTELVINALKHAFPDGREGIIIVEFEARGPSWRLIVSDDGVGMPADPALARTGLGTSIVQALAKQLEAAVEVDPASPGTIVRIGHSPASPGEEQIIPRVLRAWPVRQASLIDGPPAVSRPADAQGDLHEQQGATYDA